MLPVAIDISGFRSFGEKPVPIKSLKRLNFFVGQNNSGKSNVLRAIAMLSSIHGPDPKLTPRSADFATGTESICIYLYFPNVYFQKVLASKGGHDRDTHFRGIDENKSFAFPFGVDRTGKVSISDSQIEYSISSSGISETALRQFVKAYLGFGGSFLAQMRHLILSLGLESYLTRKVLFIPQIRTVHTVKQYVESVDQFIDPRYPTVFSGGEMIDLLFRLQRPPYDAQADKLKFNRIVQFLRDITENDSISLENTAR